MSVNFALGWGCFIMVHEFLKGHSYWCLANWKNEKALQPFSGHFWEGSLTGAWRTVSKCTWKWWHLTSLETWTLHYFHPSVWHIGTLTQSHTFRVTQVYQEINYVTWLAIIIEQAPVIEIENYTKGKVVLLVYEGLFSWPRYVLALPLWVILRTHLSFHCAWS